MSIFALRKTDVTSRVLKIMRIFESIQSHFIRRILLIIFTFGLTISGVFATTNPENTQEETEELNVGKLIFEHVLDAHDWHILTWKGHHVSIPLPVILYSPGKDLDAATQLTIDRGRRNQEVLKQAQYAPVPVDQQVAVIFASTRGYMDKVPLNKVKEYEKEFLAVMTTQHKDVMDNIREGKLDDHTLEVLKKEAGDMAKKFTNQA